MSSSSALTWSDFASRHFNYIPSDTTTTVAGPSIDQVVRQVESLVSRINDLGDAGQYAGDEISGRGRQTLNNVQVRFDGTKVNVNRIGHVLSTKTHDWPIGALYALAVCALILMIAALLYLVSYATEIWTASKSERRRRLARQLSDPADLEQM